MLKSIGEKMQRSLKSLRGDLKKIILAHCLSQTIACASVRPGYLSLRRVHEGKCHVTLTLNIPSLGRQRCLPSWGSSEDPMFFFVISQLFDAVDYSNYVFWVSETIIQ